MTEIDRRSFLAFAAALVGTAALPSGLPEAAEAPAALDIPGLTFEVMWKGRWAQVGEATGLNQHIGFEEVWDEEANVIRRVRTGQDEMVVQMPVHTLSDLAQRIAEEDDPLTMRVIYHEEGLAPVFRGRFRESTLYNDYSMTFELEREGRRVEKIA